MPPPLEASHTFSFQVSTMPSRLSSTELRKQEIGRPRVGAAIRQNRRRRHEPQLRHVVVEPLRVRRCRRRRRTRRARTCPGLSPVEQIAVVQRRLAEGGEQRVAAAIDGDVDGRARGLVGVHARRIRGGIEYLRGVLPGFARELIARARNRLSHHSMLHLSWGMGSNAHLLKSRSTRYCRHTPSDQKNQSVRRQVSWLTAPSRVVRPSRESVSVASTLFHREKVTFRLRSTVAGAAADSATSYDSPHHIPFSSRFRENRCTTRCCVSRRGVVNSLCMRVIVKKFLKWTGFVVAGLAGLVLLGLAGRISHRSANWAASSRRPTRRRWSFRQMWCRSPKANASRGSPAACIAMARSSMARWSTTFPTSCAWWRRISACVYPSTPMRSWPRCCAKA